MEYFGSELTPEETQKIVEWLDKKWTNRVCAACGQRDWEVDKNIAAPPVYNRTTYVLGGPIFPWVVVTCKNCGNSLAFSAVKMGLMGDMPGDILGEVEDVQ